MYAKLHGAKIRNIRIDPSRKFITLQIEDFYNFNKGRLSGKGQIGEFLQKTGFSKPYYVTINVKVPISILKEK